MLIVYRSRPDIEAADPAASTLRCRFLAAITRAGLLYLNCDDPAIVVGSRFGAGWTLNLGNPPRG